MGKALKSATFVWVIYPFLSCVCFLSEILFLYFMMPFFAYVEMPEIEVKNDHSYITNQIGFISQAGAFEYKEYSGFIFEKHYTGARENYQSDTIGFKPKFSNRIAESNNKLQIMFLQNIIAFCKSGLTQLNQVVRFFKSPID